MKVRTDEREDSRSNIGFEPLALLQTEERSLLLESVQSRLLCYKTADYNKIHIIDLVKIPVIAFGTLSGLPYIASASAYAGENIAMRIIYSYSITTSLGVLSTWALLDLFRHGHLTIGNPNLGCSRFISPISAIVPGFLAALPGTIISAHYNNDSPFMMSLAFTGDFIGNTCAFSHIIRTTIHKYQTLCGKKKIEISKDIFVSRLENGINSIISMPRDNFVSFMTPHNLIDYFDNTNQHIDISKLIADVINLGSEMELQQLRSGSAIRDSVIKYSVLGLTFLMPSAWAPTAFKLVANGLSFIGIELAYVTAAFSATPVFILEAVLTNLIFSKAFNGINNYISGIYKPSFAQYHYTKLYYTGMTIAVLTSLFSFATRADVIKENQEGIYRDIAIPWVIFSVILFKCSAMIDFVPSLILKISSLFGKKENLEVARTVLFLSDTVLLLKESNIKDFLQFVEELESSGALASILEQNPDDDALKSAISALQEMQERQHSIPLDSERRVFESEIEREDVARSLTSEVEISQARVVDEKTHLTTSATSDSVLVFKAFIQYDNELLNSPIGTNLLAIASKIAGSKAVNLLLDLGQDKEVAIQILSATQEQGAESVLKTLLSLETMIDNIVDQTIKYRLISSVATNDCAKDIIFPTIPQDLPALLRNSQNIYSNTKSYIYMNVFARKAYSVIEWYFKQIIYRQDIKTFYEILQNNGIDKSIDVLKNSHDFKQSVLLKLHPDKGGDKEDFIFVRDLQKQFNTALDVKKLLDDKIKTTQSIIHKATIGFKVLDMVVDSARLMYEPTLHNTKKVALDSGYLYSMYQGVNGYSIIISVADVSYQIYQGEYTTAFTQALTITSYTVLPTMLSYLGHPYFGFAYGVIMAAYTGYSAIINTHLFYQEHIQHTSEISTLRSAIAYKDLMQTLSESPLQQIYDFTTIIQSYKLQIQSILLTMEKTALKIKLVEEKGEFGKKLYDYIYCPSIEEKFSLFNQVLQGNITQEEAEVLKTKHIAIISSYQIYEHCMLIKDIGDNTCSNSKSDTDDASCSNTEHYYCYNNEQRLLDHIIIGEDNNFEVVKHLYN